MIPTTAAESNGVLGAHTDIPREPTASAEHEAWVIVLYQGGATVDEIASALALGREAVRRTVIGAGLTLRRSARQIDPLAVLREVRIPGTMSLKEVAARLGYAEETVRHNIVALGMSESVRRLFRLRRRAARRVAGAATTPIRTIATGRTPIVRVA